MRYAEAIDYLYGLRLFGQKLGLASMQELLARLGHPERGLKFLHIAGTNGKGSVAAMCHAVLHTNGYRTGLYTSPHLVSFCERFQVNGRAIEPPEVVGLVQQLRPVLERLDGAHPTFFEVVTAMALLYFRAQQVEYVCWETGLGGRLDATNVVTPVVSVITSIGMDHMQYLGGTLERIAAEKAGIIKPGVPVVSAVGQPGPLAVIRRTCQERDSSLIEVTEPLDWPTGLVGDYQRWNCATAVASLRAAGLPLAETQLRAGLLNTRWPGRFQVVADTPPVVLDGAHNPPAADQLAATLRQQFPAARRSLILGVLQDKDMAGVCAALAPCADRIWCVPVASERTSAPESLRELCRRANPAARVEVCAQLTAAYELARAERPAVILIAGSLFLVGEAMDRLPLGLTHAAAGEKERRLQ